MRGVTNTGNRTVEVRDFADPHAGPGEAVVQIRAAGLCGSDLHSYRGDRVTGLVNGHEPCGVIAELGAGAPPGLAIGDRVMVHHYAGCGVCETCTMGYEQLCLRGNSVTFGGVNGHGANSEYMLVPSRTLVPLPDELSFEEGAAVACGTGTAWNGLRKMGVSGRDTVAVFGQGPVGLSGTLCARAMGARVIAIDVIPERLRLAKELGADHVIDASAGDAVAAVRELTSGGASAGLETSGNAGARAQVLRALRPFGRACYVGLGSPNSAEIDFGNLILNVTTVFGSWTFSKSELIEIARFMVEAQVPLERMFTHRWSLEQAEEAFRLFDSGATGKCVFVLDA